MVLSAGCKKKNTGGAGQADPAVVPVLGAVVVQNMADDPGDPSAVQIDDQALIVQARQILRKAGVFATSAAAGPDHPPAPTRPVANVFAGYMILDVQEASKGVARALVKLHIGINPPGSADVAWNEDVEAGGEISYQKDTGDQPVDRGAMVSSLVSRMLDDLLGAYAARQRLRSASDDTIVSALASASDDTLEEAIRQTGQRRLTAGVDALLDLLEHDDERIRDAAIGALLQLRERRAIERLGRSRSMRDPREMGKVLEAVATLGGPEADAYLRFVIDGHEDDAIKGMARAALERMQRRQGAQTP